jgi:hypothetical protein
MFPSLAVAAPSGQNQWWNGSVASANSHGRGVLALPPRSNSKHGPVCNKPALWISADRPASSVM